MRERSLALNVFHSSNPTIDESVGISYGNDVYVAMGGEFHKYDIKDNVFKKYDSLPGRKKYFASAGYFWFNDGSSVAHG